MRMHRITVHPKETKLAHDDIVYYPKLQIIAFLLTFRVDIFMKKNLKKKKRF